MPTSNGFAKAAGHRRWMPWVLSGVFLASGLLGDLRAQPDSDASSSEGWQDERVHEATRLIDRWDGEQDEVLVQARALLDEALREDPGSAHALVQYARLVLRTGVAADGQPAEDRLQAAVDLIDRALAADPSHARAYVLLGHVHRRMSSYDAARTALETAERLGSRDPWLEPNWADLLYDEGRRDEAVARYRRIIETRVPDVKVRIHAHEQLIHHYREGDFGKESDASHRAIIEELPAAAWPRSRYANFRLCRFDDFDGAVRFAEDAIAISNDIPSQLALAAALYRKWASQVLDHNGRGAEQTWMAAIGTLPADPVAVMEATCVGEARVRPVLRALQLTGEGEAISPMFAVLLAAEHEDQGFMGLFGFQVRNVGSSGGDLFLGSEEDYRDQRNLAIRIRPEARAEFLRLHGEDPESLFVGKRITVWGRARRVRVDFTSHGMPTGKYYFQTQLVVNDATQLELQE